MKPNKYLAVRGVLATGVCCLMASAVQSEEWTDKIQLSGFGSGVYRATDENQLLHGDSAARGINEQGSFQTTRFGLNVNATVTDQLTVAAQMIGSAEEANFDAHFDWAFASMALTDDTTVRFGKIKYPVGMVNEYIDVGYAMPWIQAPWVIYSERARANQTTREAYTGASLLINHDVGNWALGLDVFAGEVSLEASDVKQMLGMTGRAEWDDKVLFQLSYYSGTMENATDMPQMNGHNHAALVAGFKVDWNDFIVYAEHGTVDMGVTVGGMMVPYSELMNFDAGYITLGRRFGKFLPHYTYQSMNQGDGDGQELHTLGLKYDLMKNTALKFEVTRIETVTGALGMNTGGLFEASPDNGDETMLYGMAIDFVF